MERMPPTAKEGAVACPLGEASINESGRSSPRHHGLYEDARSDSALGVDALESGRSHAIRGRSPVQAVRCIKWLI